MLIRRSIVRILYGREIDRIRHVAHSTASQRPACSYLAAESHPLASIASHRGFDHGTRRVGLPRPSHCGQGWPCRRKEPSSGDSLRFHFPINSPYSPSSSSFCSHQPSSLRACPFLRPHYLTDCTPSRRNGSVGQYLKKLNSKRSCWLSATDAQILPWNQLAFDYNSFDVIDTRLGKVRS